MYVCMYVTCKISLGRQPIHNLIPPFPSNILRINPRSMHLVAQHLFTFVPRAVVGFHQDSKAHVSDSYSWDSHVGWW